MEVESGNYLRGQAVPPGPNIRAGNGAEGGDMQRDRTSSGDRHTAAVGKPVEPPSRGRLGTRAKACPSGRKNRRAPRFPARGWLRPGAWGSPRLAGSAAEIRQRSPALSSGRHESDWPGAAKRRAASGPRERLGRVGCLAKRRAGRAAAGPEVQQPVHPVSEVQSGGQKIQRGKEDRPGEGNDFFADSLVPVNVPERMHGIKEN